jgi:hypothetical protein
MLPLRYNAFIRSGRVITTLRLASLTTMAESPFYSLKAVMPGNKTYDFADLKGKTVLVVNTASAW